MRTLHPRFTSSTSLNEDGSANNPFVFTWTFDDGYYDLLRIHDQLYGPYRVSFRFFVSPHLVDRFMLGDNCYVSHKLSFANPKLLSWDEIGWLIEKGHKVGLHGYDHSDFNAISHAQAVEQHEKSIELLRVRVGAETDSFAFPFGRLLDFDQSYSSAQLLLAKRYFARVYLSDNRLPPFGFCGVFNRRHAEYDERVLLGVLKGWSQYRYLLPMLAIRRSLSGD